MTAASPKPPTAAARQAAAAEPTAAARQAGGASRGRLVHLVGTTLREQRERRDLTQRRLAALAGVSQATIARVERGDRSASPAVVDRLFAAIGLQLTLGVQQLDADLDAAIDDMLAKPLEERIADADINRVLDSFPIPYVLDGATAALVQGAPSPTGDVEVAVRWSDADTFTGWLAKRYAQRWHAQWETFGFLRLDPREPGEHRWRMLYGVLRARMVDVLPASIEVRTGEWTGAAVPLADLQIDDPEVGRLLDRYRQRRITT